MNPTEFYQSLLSSIQEADVRRVAQIMAKHVGEDNLITLQELTVAAFGINNLSTERKTREILETLTTEYHLPVCSYSSKAGRWLALNEEERDAAARARARALRQSHVPAKEPQFAKQKGLWG